MSNIPNFARPTTTNPSRNGTINEVTSQLSQSYISNSNNNSQSLSQQHQQSPALKRKSARDYQFGAKIGEGSYSTVYSAIDKQHNKTYAIKVLSKKHIVKENKIKYVNIEKTTLHRLGQQHPGIVQLYYTFQDESSLFFVLDFAEYGELLSIIRKFGSLSEQVSKFYMCQILDAVKFIHSKGVIHRDLKPENILVSHDLSIKITDFGAAKLLGENDEYGEKIDYTSYGNNDVEVNGSSMKERLGSFVGTAEYVSPELLKENICGFEADIWAIGCILYQFFNGSPPFKGNTEYLTFQKIIDVDYTYISPKPLPNDVIALIDKILVSEPTQRLTIPEMMSSNWFHDVDWRDERFIWNRKVPKFESFDSDGSIQHAPVTFKNGSNRNMNKSNSYQQLQNQIQGSDFGFLPTVSAKKSYKPATILRKNNSPTKIKDSNMLNNNFQPNTSPMQRQTIQRSVQNSQQPPSFQQQPQQMQQQIPQSPLQQQQFNNQVNNSNNNQINKNNNNNYNYNNYRVVEPQSQISIQQKQSIYNNPSEPTNIRNNTAFQNMQPISSPSQPPDNGQFQNVQSQPSSSTSKPPLVTQKSQQYQPSPTFSKPTRKSKSPQGSLQGSKVEQSEQQSESVASNAAAAAAFASQRQKQKTSSASGLPQAPSRTDSSYLIKTTQPKSKQKQSIINFRDITSLLNQNEKILKMDLLYKINLKKQNLNIQYDILDDSILEQIISRNKVVLEQNKKLVLTIITNMARLFFVEASLEVMLVDLKANKGADCLMYDYEFETDDEEEDNSSDNSLGYLIIELVKDGGDLVFLEQISNDVRKKLPQVIKVNDKTNKEVSIGSDHGWIDCLLIARDTSSSATTTQQSKPTTTRSKSPSTNSTTTNNSKSRRLSKRKSNDSRSTKSLSSPKINQPNHFAAAAAAAVNINK
ncbi:PKH3 [Candida jiufengensis]|uniref:PKH3 n=1 Tax=Candida jiufengensis TaxID=497108 RepID=UPI002225A409|nr:PKH3 [Candida jiufengensis]KAI5956726.1 PKH3 [Candida jiufengensis]